MINHIGSKIETRRILFIISVCDFIKMPLVEVITKYEIILSVSHVAFVLILSRQGAARDHLRSHYTDFFPPAEIFCEFLPIRLGCPHPRPHHSSL